jgi:hypothetical protein
MLRSVKQSTRNTITRLILHGNSSAPVPMSRQPGAMRFTVTRRRFLHQIGVEKISAARLKIATDAINGADVVIFPLLLAKLCVTGRGVNTQPDGIFVHNPKPRSQHLIDLAALLLSKPDFRGGFAFDPDADHLTPMDEKVEPISQEDDPGVGGAECSGSIAFPDCDYPFDLDGDRRSRTGLRRVGNPHKNRRGECRGIFIALQLPHRRRR